MNRIHLRIPLIRVFTVLLLVISGCFWFLQSDPGQAAGDRIVNNAWQRLQMMNRYEFSTNIEQTTYPAPKISNVGRSSTIETVSLSGQTDIAAETLLLTFGQSSTGANNQTGVEVRIEKGAAWGRAGQQPWQRLDDFSTDLFAPGNDAASFLNAAKNVQYLDSITLKTSGPMVTADHYSFDLDGRAYAAIIRDQMVKELQRAGKLPTGMSLGVADELRGVIGAGEVWIGPDELPLRVKLSLVFPLQSNGQRVEANLTTDFYNFDRKTLIAAQSWPGNMLAFFGLPANPGALAGLAVETGIVLLAAVLVIWMVINTRRRAVYAAFALLVTLTMVISPLWEGARAAAFYKDIQSSAPAGSEARADSQTDEAQGWNPDVSPWVQLAAEVIAPATTGQLFDLEKSLPAKALSQNLSAAAQGENETDTDGDGLTDSFENQFPLTVLDPNNPDTDLDGLSDGQELSLGLLPGQADSDNDSIPDQAEVQPFNLGYGNLYSNPLNADTDRDGILDGIECPERVPPSPMPPGWVPGPCRNTDAILEVNNQQPLVPDIFDTDDDGDGVPTIVDESPFTLATEVFSDANPLRLNLTNLANDKIVFVDYQVRPTNAKHLTYTSNVLDWPDGDIDGQITRIITTTFGTNLSPARLEADPRADFGDLRLIPMMELQLKGSSLPLPMTNTMVVSDTVDGFRAEFILTGQPGGTTSIALNLGPIGAHPTYLGEGTCRDFTEAANLGSLSVSDASTVSVPLRDLAGGGYVLYVKDDTDTTLEACFQILPAAHGDQPDVVVDKTMLSAYGISARNNRDGSVLLYAPLNLVSDFDGTMPVAFTARVPFFSGTDGFSNSQQEARVVWMIQMLSDICLPQPADYNPLANGAWCDAAKPENWAVDQTQIVHTYQEQFNLTGLSVVEENGVDMAVAFENPINYSGPVSDVLWGLLMGLERTFYTGRDDDGDNVLDLTPAEIAHRFDPDNNGDITDDNDERFWGMPRDSFQVERYSYEFSDGVYKFMQTEVHDLFSNHFGSGLSNRPDTAVLLFARHVSLRTLNVGSPGSSCVGDTCTLDFSGQPLTTQAMLNWAPYQREEETWQSYPLNEYLDILEATLRGRPAYQPGDNTLFAKYVIDGRVAMARGHFSAYFAGVVTLVLFNASLIIKTDANKSDKDLVDTASGISDLTVEILETVSEDVINGMNKDPNNAKDLNTGAGGTKTENLQASLGEAVNNPDSPQTSKLASRMEKVMTGLAVLGFALNIATTLVDLLGSDDNQGKIAKRVLGTITGVVETINAIKDLVDAVQAYKAGTALSKAAKTLALVGLIIGAAIAWGAFIAVVVIGGVVAFSLAFNQILADTIAATITLVLLFVIGLIPVVGQIIVAVIALVDAIIMAICAAAGAEDLNDEETGEEHWVNEWICGGISGAVSKVIAWMIYSQTYMINLHESDRLNFANFSQEFRELSLGFSTGNTISMTVELANTITLSDIPIDWKAAAYFWQYSEDTARSSTFAYKVQPSEVDIHSSLDRDDISSQWVDVVDGEKWVKDFIARTDGTTIEIPEPGINQDPIVFVSEGSAVPAQECWAVPVPIGFGFILVPVCYIRTERTTFHNPLGASLTMDVFPATLDEFYTLGETGDGGYSLAWGRDTALPFPTFKDADGDGLVSVRFGGNDPDDGQFDKDADNLSDPYEIMQGSNPADFDTDGDLLHDADEVRLGSDPNRPDTDGDGLSDYEEISGWLFTYGFTSNGTPLETMVYPDVNKPDTDFDGIPDKLEKVYGFNPQAPSTANILDYTLSLRELDAPVVLLRLDEPGGASLFADSSNFGFNAVCAPPACPASGLPGRFAQGVQLDGDDFLTIPASAQLLQFAEGQPFTLGTWVNWSSGDGTLLSKWREDVGGRQAMRLDVTASGALQLVGSTGTATSAGSLPAGRWTHAAAAFDGSQVTFYIDGQPAGSGAWLNFPTGTLQADFMVGAYQGAAQPAGFFAGKVDEVMVFDRALDAVEINTSMFQAHYNLNDSFVRPGEFLSYRSIVTNLLNSRFAYGLLSTLFSPVNAVVDWAQKLQPQTFVLKPDNPVVVGVNSVTITDTLQISPSMPSSSLVIDQTAAGQIVDRRSESNLAELWLTFDTTTISGTLELFEDTSGWMPPRDAACTNACTVSSQGILNNAASFASGGNTPVALPTLAQMNLVNNSFTFAMWVRPGAGGTNLNLIDSPGNRIAIFLENSGGVYIPRVQMNNNTINFPAISRNLLPNAWSHLAVRYDAVQTSLELYVNGARVGAVITDPGILTDAALTLGGAPQDAGYLVDDLRIFSRPLSNLDINLLAERPVLKLNMDTTSYSDDSGYGQAVSTVQSPSLISGSVRGASLRPNQTLGQTGGMLQVTGNELLNMEDGAFSFSVWVKPYDSGSNTTWQGILGYNSGKNDAYPTIERRGNQVRFGFGTSTDWWFYDTDNILNVDQWNHLLVTLRPSLPPATGYEMVIYVNGEERASAIAPNPPTTSSRFFVGHSSHEYTSEADRYHMSSYSDEWLSGPPDVYINRHDPTATRIYGVVEEGTGTHYLPNNEKTYSAYETIEYKVWDDDSASADDYCGSGWHYWYSLPGETSFSLSNGFNGTLYLILTRASTMFHGEIDELEVYRYALDREQAYDLYNAIPITARLPLDDRPTSASFDNRAFVGVQDNGICTAPGCPAAGTVGLINQAVRFDGENDVIETPVDTTSDYMVSLWFNTQCANCGLYSLWSSRTGGSVLNQLFLKNGNVCARTGSSEICSTGGGLNNGQWHFVNYANQSGNTTLHLDGALTNAITTGPAVIAAPLGEAQLGFAPAAAQPALSGQLDDVRVFRYSQASEVIAQLRRRAPLVLFHLDEPQGAASFSTAAPGSWTMLCSGASCPEADTEGRLGKSVTFDGLDDLLSINPTILSNTTQSFSISSWVMPFLVRPQAQTLWAVNNASSSQRYALALEENSLRLCVRAGTGTACDNISNVGLMKDNWNYVTLVVDRVGTEERFSLYINGYLDSVGTQTSPTNGLRSLTAGAGFTGRIDEVTVSQYSLNEIEVRNIFNYQIAQVEEHTSTTLQIDADPPTVSLASYNPALPYLNDSDQVLLVEAIDFTPAASLASGIGMVQMQVNHRNIFQPTWQVAPACLDATSGTAFCPTFIPNSGDGAYTLTFSAVDRVGNQSQLAAYTVYVDDTAPLINANQVGNSLLQATQHPNDPRTWILPLSGSVIDPRLGDNALPSGLITETIRVTMYSQANEIIGEGTQLPLLSPNGEGFNWSLNYRFGEAEPSGLLRIVIEAEDRVGNRRVREIPILLDASPSIASLNIGNLPQPDVNNLDFNPGDPNYILSGTGPLTGIVRDVPKASLPYMTAAGSAAASGVKNAQAAFTPVVDVSYLFNEPYPANLLAWLPLDEAKQPVDENGLPDPAATSLLFLDISPYQQAGECSLARCPQTGFPGHRAGSTYFDGTARYINLGQSVTLSQQSFTVSAWARRNSAGSNHAILWQGPSSIPSQRFLFGLNANNRFVCGFGGTDLVSPQAYTDLDWHHWACTFDLVSGVRTIYRDGLPMASDISGAMPSRPEDLYIGLSPLGSFYGFLDDVMIQDIALDAAALKRQYQGSGQIFQLKVEDRFLTGGMTIEDSSGFYNRILLESGDTNNKVTAGKAGAFGLSFDGNDRLVVSEANNLEIPFDPVTGSAFTQSAWVYPKAAAAMDVISQKDENPEYRYPSISLTADGRIAIGFGNRYTWHQVVTGPLVTPNTWTFIAAAYDGTTYTVFVNGLPAWSTDDLAGDRPYPSRRFNIGSGFIGEIDDVRIFPRALSDLEVWGLYGLSWQNAVLQTPNPAPGATVNWSLGLMPGLEGPYRIDARGVDQQNHFDIDKRVYNQWSGVMDTLQPRVTLRYSQVTPGDDSLVTYTFSIEDLYLDENSVRINLCDSPLQLERTYYNSAWYLSRGLPPNTSLYRLDGECQGDLPLIFDLGVYACDAAGNCGSAEVPALFGNKLFLPFMSGAPGAGLVQVPAKMLQDAVSLADTPLVRPVENLPPVLSIESENILQRDVRSVMFIRLHGKVTDNSGLEKVTVRIWQGDQQVYTTHAAVYGTVWNALWAFHPNRPPLPGEYTLELEATDWAGNQTVVTKTIYVQYNEELQP